MDMNEKIRKSLGLLLYLINITLAWFNYNIDVYVSILGSTTMPFISFIIPGALYYQHLKIEDLENTHGIRVGCLIFCILGFLSIAFFLTISIHDFAALLSD